MTDRIDILINARNQTSGAFNAVKQEMRGLDDLAGQVNRGLSGLGAIAGAGAIIASIQQIGSAIDDLGRRGAIFEQLGNVLNDFAASVGGSSTAFVEAGRRAAQGTIADYDLILNANRSIQFQVAQTSEEYAKLIELSTALGRAQGITDTDALDFITRGIARQSSLILDNLGLFIDLEKVQGEYARSLGKTASELTTAEKNQAVLAEAFRQGSTAIAANRDAADSAATQYERLDANTQNLKDVLGELIAQGSAEYIKLLADQIQYATEVLEGRERLPEWMTGIGDAMQEAGASMTSATVQTAVLSQALQLMGAVINGVDQQALAADTRAASDAFTIEEGAIANAGVALQMMGSSASVAAMEAQNLKFAALDGADGLSTLESLAWSTATSLDAVTQASGRAAAVAGRLGAIRQAAIGQAESLAMRAIQAGADPKQTAAQFAEQADQIQNMGLNMEMTNEAMFANKVAVMEASGEYNNMLGSIIEADQAAQKAARSTGGISEAARDAQQAFDDLTGKVSGVLSESLNLDVGVNTADILPREDAINENARRLADIAVKGFDSPWFDYFKNEFPALFQEFFAGAAGGDGIKQQAAQLLKNFEDGLQPQLLDKDKAKERVRRILLGEANMAQLAQEIASELSAEFGGSISLGKIQATASAALGVDEGNADQLAKTLTGAASVATEQLSGAGSTFRTDVATAVGEIQAAISGADAQLAATLTGAATGITEQLTSVGKTFRDGIVSALDGIGEVVATTVDKQFRAEGNLKIITEAGRANGEAWSSGFLTAMDSLSSQVLEKLATLVGPYVEAIQARNQTLNGAN